MQLRDALLAWSGALQRPLPPMCILFRICPESATPVCRSKSHGAKTAEGRYAMICTACGKANTDSSAFCEQCGTRMQAQPAATPAAAFPVSAAPATAPATPFAASQLLRRADGRVADRHMSLGEKIASAGAVAAILGYFMPWISIAGSPITYSGLALTESTGALALVVSTALASAIVCYLSIKATASKKRQLDATGWYRPRRFPATRVATCLRRRPRWPGLQRTDPPGRGW